MQRAAGHGGAVIYGSMRARDVPLLRPPAPCSARRRWRRLRRRTAAVAVQGTTLRVKLDEYRIQPQNVRMPAGRIHLVARQRRAADAQPRRSRRSRDDPSEGASSTGAPTPPTRARRSRARRRSLKPGRYRLACTISNHENLGQYGTLTSREVTRRRHWLPP